MIVTTRRNESSVGVGILDCDHREMDETLQELNAEIVTGNKYSQAGYLLRRLARFTLVHFALEEGMMEATKYPGLAQHRARHQRLAKQMNALVSLSDRARGRQYLSLLPVSHDAHIENDDVYFGIWLNEQGGS
jgi:hemerythrin